MLSSQMGGLNSFDWKGMNVVLTLSSWSQIGQPCSCHNLEKNISFKSGIPGVYTSSAKPFELNMQPSASARTPRHFAEIGRLKKKKPQPPKTQRRHKSCLWLIRLLQGKEFWNVYRLFAALQQL